MVTTDRGMERAEFQTKQRANSARLGASYNIRDMGASVVGMKMTDGAVIPGVCSMWEVGEADKPHLVVLGYNPIDDRFLLWCGDAFLEGGPKGWTSAHQSQMKKTLADAGFDADSIARAEAEVGGAQATVAFKSVGCNFWRQGGTCKHTKGVIHSMTDDALSTRMDKLVDMAESKGFRPGVNAKAPKVAGLAARLARYSFIKHVLIEGDKGSGKTVGAEMYAASLGIKPVEVCGHEGIEATDLLGHFVRLPDGSMAWKDGQVTQAFRRAANGEKTILIMDELLRIPQRHLSVLISSLSPSAQGTYRLATGRATGVTHGVICEEVLECPTDMLWVVGTTNIGADYAVDDIDSALSDRFRRIREDTTEAKIKTVLGDLVAERGFKSKLVGQLVAFWQKMQRARAQGELTQLVNLRHLCEVVRFAADESDVPAMMEDLILTWVDRNTEGAPIDAQIKMVEKIIKDSLK